MLIHKDAADGAKTEPSYHVVSNVMRYMVDMRETEAARKVGAPAMHVYTCTCALAASRQSARPLKR